eukprot:1159914-Pelagomonas_calceolata.AAC.2
MSKSVCTPAFTCTHICKPAYRSFTDLQAQSVCIPAHNSAYLHRLLSANSVRCTRTTTGDRVHLHTCSL